MSDEGESGVATARIDRIDISAWNTHCTRSAFSLNARRQENAEMTKGAVEKSSTKIQPADL